MPDHHKFPTDTRVRFDVASSSPNPPGTVVNGTPNREGQILVAWDGLGTHFEDPADLALVEDAA
ncbi:Uncharacterised protein (plasmid) [Tsukamurella tyrosinosolvens]|uniref:Uncharacterized protein n=1 Tax=Tsukamurella tyrosinosolvens TaxID=57704 RepID=A0A1H4V106_TSUTY|nr:hypothetical protein [Tsukamurella tyrosinosolvens]KXO91089.1 hypothetical protein AXK58_21915 [Tsukamurella tyrosinosolvens]SEC74338.1 hypothetical protein SAMN04489793_3096 [Tsukamurella tyrosinosolvens]VEH90769.1 Uncharacterised protein [Tsukamurella tyrosinosolvens]